MRASVGIRCNQAPQRRAPVHTLCSGKLSNTARVQPSSRMPPPQALFIAKNMLRNANLGISVPKSIKPQHVSEELVMRYFLDVWNESDIEVVKEICSEDIVMSDVAMWPDPFNGQDHVVRVIEEHMDAFKLYRYTYVQALATPDGKEVLAHWSVRCAQLGDLWNRPPTGAVEEISGMTRFVVEKKKITRIETFREKMQHEMASVDYGL